MASCEVEAIGKGERLNTRRAPASRVDPSRIRPAGAPGKKVMLRRIGYAETVTYLGNAGLGGAAYRTRTCDPIITNDVLYQLS